MIDLALFRRPAFSLALGANTLAFAVVFGIEVFVAQYFQLVLGYSPLEAGLWSVPAAAAFVVGSQLDAAARRACAARRPRCSAASSSPSPGSGCSPRWARPTARACSWPGS